MRHHIHTAALAAIVAGSVAFFVPRPAGVPAPMPQLSAPAAAESTYDRVMRTGTIRCGYINYPPHFIIDPTTGAKSGIMYDVVTEMARLLDFKVEWTEELGWATTVETLKSGRVDAICTSFWQNPVEGKHVGFTLPLFYSPVGVYVRADEANIKSVADINNANVRISSADGALSSYIAQRDYPLAQLNSLPNMTDETQLLIEVATKKADVTLVETYLGEKYNQSNGHPLKNIAADPPAALFGNTIALPMGDVKLKSMFDSALIQMLQGGTIEHILKKYEEVPGGIYRVAKPYALP